jgi:hypothetical protein
MTVMLELTPEMEAALKEEAVRQGLSPEGLTEQALMRELILGLKNRPVPQMLDEIKPRRLPPLGRTAMQMVYQQLPSDESDEELQAALKAMS